MGSLLGLLVIGTLIGLGFLVSTFFDLRVAIDRLRNAFGTMRSVSRAQELVGNRGTVVSAVSPDTGQVDVDGELWEARTHVPETIRQGERIVVDDIISTVLFVSRIDAP